MRSGSWRYVGTATCSCGTAIDVQSVKLKRSIRVTLRICPRCDRLEPVGKGA